MSELHHYVPQMLLRRFAENPVAERPMLHRLDKATGACERRGVRGEAAVMDYNELHEVEGLPERFVESTLGLVEDQARPVIDELVAGGQLDPGERVAMALFMYFQYHRTPRGRQWDMHTLEQAHTLDAIQRLLDPHEIQALYKRDGEDISLEGAERLGREWIDDLDSGKLVVKGGQDHAVGAMFLYADSIVPRIAEELSWEVLHAPDGADFVVSDHPILIHDPAAPPGYGAGWLSSPRSNTTCPIDTTAAVRLFPGSPILRHVNASRSEVADVNLRTYASAEWAIYGRSPRVVQSVRAQAKKHRQRVSALKPAPPTLHILEQVGSEPVPRKVTRLRSKGKVNRRQRWPRWDE